jgi:hypothetical protein
LKGGLSLNNEISKEKAEMIFKEHSNYIYRVALFLSKSKELADDITQETFIQVFRKYYTFDSSKPIQPWIENVDGASLQRNSSAYYIFSAGDRAFCREGYY